MIERLHLVDGTFELFRFHYSKRPSHSARNGQPIKATIGMLEGLLSLLESEDEAVTHLAIAFDNPIRSFRNDLFAGYKTDAGVDPELLAQFDLAERATEALGLATWGMRDFEADDGLATGAHKLGRFAKKVRILSPDKDLGQCVEGERIVLVDRIRKRTIDEAAILERFGVPPRAIPDYLGLVGDAADGIPGVPGFGDKSARAVLEAFGSIEAIPDDAAAWPPIRSKEKLGAALASQRREALLYKRLATLRTDAPVSEELEELRVRGPNEALLDHFVDTAAAPRIAERARALGRR
ncbi:MAG: flap endonuclease [Deltaproteobacteria bacterium]|nr:flap endonuclease [Deltaproteobacteria bacterium]